MKASRFLSDLGGFGHDIEGKRIIFLISIFYKGYKNKGTDLLS